MTQKPWKTQGVSIGNPNGIPMESPWNDFWPARCRCLTDPENQNKGGNPLPQGEVWRGGSQKPMGNATFSQGRCGSDATPPQRQPSSNPEAHQWPIYPPRKHVFPMGFERFHVLANLSSRGARPGGALTIIFSWLAWVRDP